MDCWIVRRWLNRLVVRNCTFCTSDKSYARYYGLDQAFNWGLWYRIPLCNQNFGQLEFRRTCPNFSVFVDGWASLVSCHWKFIKLLHWSLKWHLATVNLNWFVLWREHSTGNMAGLQAESSLPPAPAVALEESSLRENRHSLLHCDGKLLPNSKRQDKMIECVAELVTGCERFEKLLSIPKTAHSAPWRWAGHSLSGYYRSLGTGPQGLVFYRTTSKTRLHRGECVYSDWSSTWAYLDSYVYNCTIG